MSANLSAVPTSYNEAVEFLGNHEVRAAGYRTWVVLLDNDIGIQHHNTVIARFHKDNSITLDPKGWSTVTTKARLNAVLRDSPWSIYAQRGELWLHNRRALDVVEFEDGDRVYLDDPTLRIF